MKKFWPLLLLLVSSLFIMSCDKRDDNNYVDHGTISTVIDYKNVNFSYDNSIGWNFYRTFTSDVKVYNSDVVLIYLQTDTSKTGAPV